MRSPTPELHGIMSQPKLWRCPKHGPLEPHRFASEWGSGEPGEYGTCPVMEDEDTGCGRTMEPVPASPTPPALDAEERERLEKELKGLILHYERRAREAYSESRHPAPETPEEGHAEGEGDAYEDAIEKTRNVLRRLASPQPEEKH